MATNQELRHASVCDALGTTPTNYNADWSALFDDTGVPEGPFNGRLLAWINDRLSASYTSLPGAMQAFAADQGFASWDDMGTFDAAGSDPDAEAYFAAVGGLDATHETAITALVRALKAASVWPKIGRLYLLANENATAARTDLKTAGDVLTVNGAPVFAADAGYTGDGVSDWLVSTYNPTGSGLVGQDDAHLIAVDATSEAYPNAASGVPASADDDGAEVYLSITSQSTGAGPFFEVNADGFATGAGANSLGIWIASRTTATDQYLYLNGAEDTADAQASVALPDAAFTILARTAAGSNPCSHQIRAAGIGSGLTAGEAATFTTAIEAYLDAIGAGVIP